MAYRLLDKGDVTGFLTHRAILPKPIKRSFSSISDSGSDNGTWSAYSTRSKDSLIGNQAENRPSSARRKFFGVKDDLPVAPAVVPSVALQYYIDRPAVRKLDWVLDDNGNPKRKDLVHTISITAAFVYTRGELARNPCTSCSEGNGIWKACVIGSYHQNGKPMSMACANCRFAQRYGCSLRPINDNDEGSEIATPAAGEAPISSTIRPMPRTRKRRQVSLPALRVTNSSGRIVEIDGKCNPATEVAASARHDGEVIPFPLRSSAFINLPLLKRAAKDLTAHLEVVERRIAQLEEEKRQNTINLWDSMPPCGIGQ